MRFDIPSFFAGIMATLGILTVGFGGGVMMSGVLSDGAHQPNRVERQASRETAAKETKPTTGPVVVTVPAQAAPAETQAATAVSPEPVVSQTATPPQPEPQSAQQAQQTAAQPPPPSLGPQRPVSLAQPAAEESRASQSLSRREEARLRAQQWREKRAHQREERRKQMADRRRQEEMRRAERWAVEQSNRQNADDDHDDERPVVRERGFFGGPFGLFR
jgi:hypothetical protein